MDRSNVHFFKTVRSAFKKEKYLYRILFMMQHMFNMEMLICQFKFVDFFLPSEMTNFSDKCRDQLWGVCLWEHPARLLRFSIM